MSTFTEEDFVTHIAPTDPILSGVATLFVGGELEVISRTYAYRGKIDTLKFVPASETRGAEAHVTLQWNAKADGQPMGMGYVPTNGWDEDTELTYVCNTDLPSSGFDEPHKPNVVFEMTHTGLRARITNPYTGETTVFYAKGGSQLDTNKVRWLPDGPKARAEALANTCGLDR